MSQKDALLYHHQACRTRDDGGSSQEVSLLLVVGGGSDGAHGAQRGSTEQGVLPLLCAVLLIVWRSRSEFLN